MPRKRRPDARLAAALRRVQLGALAAERAYVRGVRGIMRGIHDLMLSQVEQAGKARYADAAKDDIAAALKAGKRWQGPDQPSGNAQADVAAVLRAVMPQIPPKVTPLHKRLTDTLDRNYRSQMSKVPGIKLAKLDPKVQQAAINARDASIQLVEQAARVYAQQVREVFDRPDFTEGRRWEDLRDELLERADVSESRAELIARDQTLKLNGAINRARQEGAGIDRYVWSTSGDERVREEHDALDGETFSWDSPPEPGHPGQDFQCRCVAIPVIDLGDADD